MVPPQPPTLLSLLKASLSIHCLYFPSQLRLLSLPLYSLSPPPPLSLLLWLLPPQATRERIQVNTRNRVTPKDTHSRRRRPAAVGCHPTLRRPPRVAAAERRDAWVIGGTGKFLFLSLLLGAIEAIFFTCRLVRFDTFVMAIAAGMGIPWVCVVVRWV